MTNKKINSNVLKALRQQEKKLKKNSGFLSSKVLFPSTKRPNRVKGGR